MKKQANLREAKSSTAGIVAAGKIFFASGYTSC